MAATSTAEGVFKLVDRASPGIKSIKNNALEGQKALQGMGKSLDNVGSAKVQQGIGRTNKAINETGDNADKSARRVEKLVGALKVLEKQRATAKADVDIAAAEAKIRILKRELRSISTQEAQAELTALGLVAEKTTAKLVGDGGGGGGSLTALKGGGGGAGGVRGGLAGGFFAAGGRMLFMAGAAAALAPALVALTGTISALAGSLGAAVGGGLALGAGGLGALAVGLVGVIAVAKPALNTLKELKKAQDEYNKAVQQYGSGSAQAAQAKSAFNTMSNQNKGAASVLQNRQVLSNRWKAQTGSARGDFFGILNSGLSTANDLLPTFGRTTNYFFEMARRGVDDFLRPFRGSEWKGIIRDLGGTAGQSVGPVARGLGNIALFLGRVARASGPRVVATFQSMESWTKSLAGGASNSTKVEGRIGGMVDQLKSWVDLLRASGRLMTTFFGSGADEGQSVVEKITVQFDKWSDWIDRNPAKMDRFFQRTIDSAGKLANALGEIAGELGRIADNLIPVLNLFSNVTNAVGDAGPGGGLLGPLAAYGAYRGLRGMAGGRGGGGRGSGFLSRFRGAGGAGAGAGEAVAGGSRILGAGKTLLGGAARKAGPLALALGAYDFLSTQGTLAERSQSVLSGFTFGLIHRPELGVEARNRGLNAAGKVMQGSTSDIQKRIDALQGDLSARVQFHYGIRGNVGNTRDKLQGKDRIAAQAELKSLQGELKVRLKIEDQEKARRAFDDILSAFDTRFSAGKKGMAANKLFKDLRKEMKTLGPDGKRDLLSATNSWIDQLETGGKKQKAIARDLKSYVIDQFGKLEDGTGKHWSAIRSAMSTNAEQALEDVSKAFTALQREAMGALTSMGFSRSSARQIVQNAERGNISLGAARGLGAAGMRGQAQAKAYGKKGDGIGGSGGFRRGDGVGLMGANSNLAPYAAMGAKYGLSVSSGLRPGAITSYGNTSFHASGNAIDIAGAPSNMMAFAKALEAKAGPHLEELIYTPLGYSIKNGKRVPPIAAADHYDHVHVADTSMGSLKGGGMGGNVHLKRRHGAQGTLANLVQAASNAYAGGLEKNINKMTALSGGDIGGGGFKLAKGSYGVGQLSKLWIKAGGDPSVARLMSAIAMAESSGNPNAYNPSGATGLWQILGNPFPGNARDPFTNARMAVAKYNTQGLGAWEAYTKGMYRRFMGDGIGRTPVRSKPGRPTVRRGGGGASGGGGITIAVHIGSVVNHEPGDIARIVERELKAVARNLLHGTDDDEMS